MIKTTNPESLLNHVVALIGAGRTEAARPILSAARQSLPASSRVTEVAALLEMRDGNLNAARVFLDEGVALAPDHSGLRKLRSELRLHQEDITGALSDAAESVILNPIDPAGKALLGMVLLQVGQVLDAQLCLREAVSAWPDNANLYQALAAAEEAQGTSNNAAGTLEAGIAAVPDSIVLRNEAILLAIRNHNFLYAVKLAEDTRRHGIADACAFGLLGHALSSLGRHDEAGEAYGEALKLGPDDPYVRHLVTASGTMPSAPRAPDGYVRAVFDGYADRFDAHLISLGYRVPGLLRAAVVRHLPYVAEGRILKPILDLGCGTGLVGVALSDLSLRHWVGVDLSPRMLDLARVRNLYDELHATEICAFLGEEKRRFPLILAADVLCYFGDLDTPLSAMAAALAPEGLIMLTVEELPEDGDIGGWALGRQGRYAHRRADLITRAVRAGLHPREVVSQILRQEAGADVRGLLVILEHSR